MPKLRIIAENKNDVEIEVNQIDIALNEILKDPVILMSPKSTPTIEHPSDRKTGHFPAGSNVYMNPSRINDYYASQKGETQDYITYTFKVYWDENLDDHAKDKHWNVCLYKTFHVNSIVTKKEYYSLPKINGLNHIYNSLWIIIEIINDNNIISSRKFENIDEHNK